MSDFIIESVVDIKKNHVSFDRDKYFRRSAHKMELCSYGRKHASAIEVNYMSVSGKIARQHLETVPIQTYGPIEVNWMEVTQEDLYQGVSLKYFGFNTDVSHTFDQVTAQKQGIRLMSFWIEEDPLKKCLNKHAHAVRKAMAEERKDARIVSSILVAMDTRLAEHFSSQSETSMTVSGEAEHLEITAGSGRTDRKSIQLAPDTTFAYGLHKVKKWTNGKSEIKQLEDDWFSFG